MSRAIPHSRPLLGEEEEQAALRVLRSGQLAQGPEVAALETEARAFLGTRHAVALAHGTAALHLGLVALGARPGTTVLVPSYGCTSLANAVHLCGATPLLVDCAPDLPDMDLEAALARVRPDTVAALVPQLFGRPPGQGGRPPALQALEEAVPVLSDGTHAVGATAGRRPAARMGRACAFSFYATKMLAGGEGGLLVTDRTGIANLARDLRSYDERPDWRPRFNYKMTEVAAAVLRVQFRRLPEFLARRRELAARYRAELGGILELPPPVPGEVPYRFAGRVPARRLEPLIRALRDRGIGAARPVFRPLHRYFGLPAREFPEAEKTWRTTLSLPLYPALTDEEAERVIRAVREELAAVRSEVPR